MATQRTDRLRPAIKIYQNIEAQASLDLNILEFMVMYSHLRILCRQFALPSWLDSREVI